MKWYEKAEKFAGRDWWWFICGFLASSNITQALLIYQLPNLIRIFREAGLA